MTPLGPKEYLHPNRKKLVQYQKDVFKQEYWIKKPPETNVLCGLLIIQ